MERFCLGGWVGARNSQISRLVQHPQRSRAIVGIRRNRHYVFPLYLWLDARHDSVWPCIVEWIFGRLVQQRNHVLGWTNLFHGISLSLSQM